MRAALCCIQLLIAGSRAPADNGRRVSLTGSFLERQRGRAECAFGKRPAEIPMGAAASGAVIDFIFAIHGVIAAKCRVEGFSAGFNNTQHALSFLPFARFNER